MSNFPVESGGTPPERDPGRDAPRTPPLREGELPEPGGSDQRDWQEVFNEIEAGLRRFLAGKLPQQADVDDCLQSVFISMLRNRNPVPIAARRAWLYRVAGNEAARWWRKKSVTDRVMEKHANDAYTIDTDSPHRIETEETIQQVTLAIERLPENARQIVQMRIHQAMTFRAIADQLDLPLGTVLTRMRRAMMRLRDEFDPDETDA